MVANTPPLGYILGDEGSGAVLGKLFVADALKGLLPESLTRIFFEETGLTKADLQSICYYMAFLIQKAYA